MLIRKVTEYNEHLRAYGFIAMLKRKVTEYNELLRFTSLLFYRLRLHCHYIDTEDYGI